MMDLSAISLGDYIIAVSGLLMVASLFMPWFVSSVPRSHTEWAFTYSEWISVFVIIFFLATLFLILYPVVSPELGLPPLPFATPVVFMAIGVILLLLFTYSLGRYECIVCQGTTRGFGVWVAEIFAILYIVGAIIKWGSRPRRTFDYES